jgi:hypothetical protein
MKIDRNKFKSELGKQLYDALLPLAPHEDWLALMLMLSRGDDRRKILLDFIKTEKNWDKIDDFIIAQWG